MACEAALVSGIYSTPRWRAERARFLRRNPRCPCGARSDTVDHIIRHRGDPVLFWDRANWQALCKRCHDVLKTSMERNPERGGCSADGVPRYAGHPWNNGAGIRKVNSDDGR